MLGGEKQAAHLPLDRVERGLAFALGVQHVADLARVDPAMPQFDDLALQRHGGKVQMVPAALAQQVAREVVLVQPLHDRDDGAGALVVGRRMGEVSIRVREQEFIEKIPCSLA